MFVDLADTLVSVGVADEGERRREAYDDKRYAPQAYVPIAEDVTEDVEIYLAERADRFPGVVVERKAVRVYPYGTARRAPGGLRRRDQRGGAGGAGRHGAGRRVSTTTTSSTTTTAADGRQEKPYELGDSIGKTGVERSYESDLRGGARASAPSRSTPRATWSTSYRTHVARRPATTSGSPSTSTCRPTPSACWRPRSSRSGAAGHRPGRRHRPRRVRLTRPRARW